MVKFNTNFNLSLLFLTILSIFYSCSNAEQKIYLKKVEGSPKYENSSLELKEITDLEGNYTFSFVIENYDLGIQTKNEFDYNLANSDKGQHIHFIVNNGPYSAHYEENFSKPLDEESNVILAFLSRSYHESIKNKDAFILTQVGDKKIDLDNELLFYSRPKGTYRGDAKDKVLLDFYLVNSSISATGNKVRATIQGQEFIIDEWAPYYIEGLDDGEINIKLELIDSFGKLIDTPFNPSDRVFTLE